MSDRQTSTKLLSLLEYALLTLLVVRSFSEALAQMAIYIGPFTVNPSIVLVLLMDAVAVLYLAIFWFREQWTVDRLGLFFMAWVLSLAPWVYIATSQWGIPGLTGAREWVRLLSLVLLYLVVWTIARRRGHERVINACLLALPVPLAVTYYQILTLPAGERAFGVMVHPNNLAAFLVIMIVLTVWKLARPHQSLARRGAWAGLLLAEFFALIAPVSSNGWLMFAVFLLAFFLLARGRRFKLAGLATAAAFLAIFLVVFALNPRIQQEFWGNLVSVGIESPDALGPRQAGSLEGRFYMWAGLYEDWQRRPLLGYGLNTAYFLNPITGKAAHSDYLRYLVEGGALGLLLFVLFQVAAGWELLRLRREANDSQGQLLAGIAFGVLLAWVIGSIGDNLISYTVFHVYFWALLACASAAASTRPYPVPAPVARWIPGSGAEAVADPVMRRSASRASAQAPASLRGWLAPAASLGMGGSSQHDPECGQCCTPALTPGAIICRKCFRPLVGWGRLSALFVLVVAVVGLIGFYIWSKGAGIETFYLGWLLWYALVALTLRNLPHRYLWGLSVTVLVGLVALPLLHPVLSEVAYTAARLAGLALVGLALYGLLASWWRVRQQWELAIWKLLPAGLAALGAFGWLTRPALGVWRDALGAAGSSSTSGMDVLGTLRPYLEGQLLPLSWPVPLPEALAALAALSFLAALSIRSLAAVSLQAGIQARKWALVPVNAKEMTGALLALSAHYARCYLLPLGALFTSVTVLNYLVLRVSEFIYGRPEALGEVVAGLVALFTALWLFGWGITRRSLRATLLDYGLTHLFMLVLVQVGVWIATGALWGTSRLLPLFPFTERFAPLLHERPIGLYTWISLGVFTAFALGISGWALRRRAHR